MQDDLGTQLSHAHVVWYGLQVRLGMDGARTMNLNNRGHAYT